MKKSSLVSLGALLALSVFLFTACPEEGGTTFTASTKEITNGEDPLGFEGTSVASSDETVATVAFNDNTTKAKIVITSKKEGSATITVSATDYSPAIIPVTVAADGAITLGTITTGLFFSLASGADVNPTGLKIVSAKKDATTGVTTITLGGTVSGGIPGWTKTNIWGGSGGGDKPAGNWSSVVIRGIVPSNLGMNSGIEIKHTNESFRYYTYTSSEVSAGNAGTPPMLATIKPTQAITTGQDVWLGSSTSDKEVFKWKKYTGETSTPIDTTDGGFGILLWSGANPKKATLEIKPASGTAYTVIVDWSGLTINN